MGYGATISDGQSSRPPLPSLNTNANRDGEEVSDETDLLISRTELAATKRQLRRFLIAAPFLMLLLFVLTLLFTTTKYSWKEANGVSPDRFNGPPKLACSRGLPPDGGISGYFNLPSNPKLNYFYYFAASKTTPMKDAPLLLWMSGGPGCSSLLASYMENGPCRVRRNNDTKLPEAIMNEYGWNEEVNVVWVDQPADVGLSYGDNGNSSLFSHKEVSANMLAFLHRWQQRFPDSHNGELYIFAESFGGHYAPAVGHNYFMAEQVGLAPEGLKLAGVGVGNGLTNPTIQYQYAPIFANNNTYGIKSVSDAVYLQMKRDVPHCIHKIKKCNRLFSESGDEDCMDAFLYCNDKLQMPFFETGRNIYDIRTFESYKDDMAVVTDFVNQHKIRNALDADNGVEFVACNMNIYMRFLFDWMKEYEDSIPVMLENGVDILIYAGDADFILNWMGNEAWVKDMDWAGKETFNEKKERDFVYRDSGGDGVVGGVGRDVKLDEDTGRLTFLRVYNAGHLAPRDQPVAMLEMINRFVRRNAIID